MSPLPHNKPLPEFKARAAAEGSPGVRTCCLLTDEMPALGPPWKRFTVVDPKGDLTHKSYKGGDAVGQVYTCGAGFLDVGHMRDLCDLTLYYYRQVQKNRTPGAKFKTSPEYDGTVEIVKPMRPTDTIPVARRLAYDQAVYHEIESYWVGVAGMHNSAFSPEDNTSNWFGTYVGMKAIEAQRAGVEFDVAATNVFGALLQALGALPPAGTSNAVRAIEGLWVLKLPHWARLNVRYLRRRNFDVDPVTPWVIKSLPDCAGSGGIWPHDLDLGLPAEAAQLYRVTFPRPRHHALVRPDPLFGDGDVGAKVRNADFGAEIQRIREHALATYGPRYDRRD